ncbi:hypothetical protein G4H71_05585 [Rhodococcus triatomae]|nr:hypothetical protein G4H72_02460 [Rhodococcus triatomae]QNG25558.1 hypothetical protein G4H71_05585 [Rhodococcus triatomae]
MSRAEGTPADTDDRYSGELFRCVLDMAEAARREDSTRWIQARCRTHRADDSAYLTSMLLGLMIESDALRQGVHPADAWQRIRRDGPTSLP